MTTIAVVLALGVMPLNLWIYTRYWEELAVAIPYRNLLITLTVTTVPAGLGYLVSWRLPKAGLILAKVMGMSNWDNLRFILSYWLLSLLVFTLQGEALYRGDGPAFVRRLSIHYFTFPETAALVKVKYYGKLPIHHIPSAYFPSSQFSISNFARVVFLFSPFFFSQHETL